MAGGEKKNGNVSLPSSLHLCPAAPLRQRSAIFRLIIDGACVYDRDEWQGRATVFQIRVSTDLSESWGGGTSVCIWSQECKREQASFSMSAAWTVRARTLSFGMCIYVHVLYARTRALESRRIPTRRASSCFLYRRAFFTANERVFGALITSAFYIIHGMEEDRGCENNRSWIIRMTMEEFRLYRWKEILINIRYFDRSYIYLFIY